MKNCDCIQRIEQNMAEYMQEQAGDGATAKIVHSAIMITDKGLEAVLQIPFAVKGSKKGFMRLSGKEIGCNASYCPFCGKEANRKIIEGKCAGLASAYTEQGASHD